MSRLRGRVAVVTGAASGIGEATARALIAAGARVYAADIDLPKLEALAQELGDAWLPRRVDCRDPAALEELAAAVYEAEGRCDLLHNNAGVGHLEPAEATSLETWRWVLDLNLNGVIYGIHAFVPRMLAQGSPAHIFNTASLAGLLGVPRMAPYCASKFAVVGLSEALDIELADRGIRVTAICPGFIDTAIARSGRFDVPGVPLEEAIARFHKLARRPEEVAAAVVRAYNAGRGGIRPVAVGMLAPYALKRLSTRLYQGLMRRVDRWLLARSRRLGR